MTTLTGHLYIVRDDAILNGEPIVKGTRTPVRAVVETWRMGVAAEEIVTHMPHLTLAQVFDALSYFADHQEEIMGYIQRNHVGMGNGNGHQEAGEAWLKRLEEFSKGHQTPAQEIDLDRDRLFEELQG